MVSTWSWRQRNRWVIHAVIFLAAVAVVLLIVLIVRRQNMFSERDRRENVFSERASRLRDAAGLLDIGQWLPPPICTDELGRPLYSWRPKLLQCGPDGMWPRVDHRKSWCDPINHSIASTPVFLFCLSEDNDGPGRLDTNVFAVTGPGTAFDSERQWTIEDLDADTILLVEVANSGIHWMAPGDLDIDHVPPSLTAGPDSKGFHVAFADCTVWFLRPDVPLDDLEKLFTVEGAKQFDREDLLSPYGGRVTNLRQFLCPQ